MGQTTEMDNVTEDGVAASLHEPGEELKGTSANVETAVFTLLTTGLGLKSHHRLLEVGSGLLPTGRLLMTFLHPGRYHAFDRHSERSQEDIRTHCGQDLIRIKQPHFEEASFFQYSLFRQQFDFILTHWHEFPTTQKALSTFLDELYQCMHPSSSLVAAMPKVPSDQSSRLALEDFVDLASSQGFSTEFLQIQATESVRWVIMRRHAAFGQQLRLPPAENIDAQPADNRSAVVVEQASTAQGETARRIEEEIARYAECIDVHNLPEIYHFWSNGSILPKLKSCGFESVDDFFLQFMIKSCQSAPGTTQQFISLGAGNCDLEVDLAVQLRDQGFANFHCTCLELNPVMVERGRKMAEDNGLGAHFSFLVTDIGGWNPETSYDICLANHSLHHFIELEDIFAKVKQCIHPGGIFLANDMIGRNGHMRWPEALEELEEIWQDLPEKYKYNHQLKRLEHEFDNWDCSVEGNEGIRAQDILPLLLKDFHFEVFIGFANLIDIFVDRSFGHNYDPNQEEDLAIIQKVADIDEALLDSGQLKPTHMLAAMRTTPVEDPTHYKHWTAEFCVRYPD